MSNEPSDKKNSLQSTVDSIQTQAISSVKAEPVKGYVPNPELKSLRTFQGDVQEHIDVKKETVATIALAEQKKKIEHNEPTYTERTPHSSHTGLIITVSLICLIAGGIIFGGVYFLNTQKESETTVATTEPTILPYTHKKEILLNALTSDIALPALLSEKNSFKAEVNSILYTPFVYGTQQITTADMLDIFATHAGDTLKRNISEVMVGIYSYTTNEIFFIIRPDDFGIAYSEMLSWENSLGRDMSPFFPGLQIYSTTNPPLFTDEIYKNKDVRVIRNDAGHILFLYGFIDKETLVLTANEKIFEAILNKYNQSKFAR